MKFSSELLVLFLAFLAVGFNLYFFTGITNNRYSDQSYAAKFLSFHIGLNEKLYAKNTRVVTTIIKDSGFIPEVQAQDLQVLSNEYAPQQTLLPDEDYFNNDILTRPAAGSVDNLIAKQIKVYQTKQGDTLASIARENGISIQTIMWANKLPSATIKPGWFLVILPTDGILYQANSNDTLPDLAKKYSGTLDTIISYNGLANAEDIDAGQLIIIPDGKMPEPPKPKAAPKTKNPTRPSVVDNGTGHIFPWGYCTWYVATRVHVPWGGNAKNWLSNAKSYGAMISNTPTPGSIVVTTDNRRFGHVAYVESVDEGGFTVSEMNFEKFGRINTRWIPNGSKIIRGFILP